MHASLPRSLALAALLAAASAAWPASAAADDEPASPPEAAGEVEPEAQPEQAPEEEQEVEVEIEVLDATKLKILEGKRQMLAFRERVSPRVQRYIQRAQKELDGENTAEAERLLLKIQESRLNLLEQASVLRFLGFLAYNDGRPSDAIAYFKRTLELDAMQISHEIGIRFGIAQLYLSLGEWQQAIDWFYDGLKYTPEPEARNFYAMALAYFQLKDFDMAIAFTRKAIATKSTPEESWLRLLSALYAVKESYPRAIPVLEELVLRYPKRSYWVQLSLMYAANAEFATSLAVQQAAYAQDFLVESKELLRFARSYLYHDLPHASAELLERELGSGRIEADREAYELLANSWIAAREYDASLPPLRQAAQLAEDGKLYVRLGQVHMQREEWQQAADYLQEAFDKGVPDKIGNAHVLLGIAYLNLERTAEARRSFQRAREHEDSRPEADRWLDHLEKEAIRSQQAAQPAADPGAVAGG